MERGTELPADGERMRSTGDRLSAQLEAERFYGVIPDHVWEALRHGDELGRDIAAAAGLVRWRRQALRRAVAALRRHRQAVTPAPAGPVREGRPPRFVAGFVEAHRLYREAQAAHRALLDERWRRRLNEFRSAP
jgi:hypothetical protein